uniref:2-phosphoxylose phosphatase 1 n=1 Tax=Lygus hesperus TaxID=30085 RepID=A0A0A9WWG5_LYGHE
MSDGVDQGQGMASLSSFILRLSLQHRALYCYLVLSLWILVLLGVMYKYISLENDALNVLRLHSTDVGASSTVKQFKFSIKSRKVVQSCNHYSEISAGAEGNFNANYSLEGALILIRHGDRGPLTHVHNISNVNCGGIYDPLYTSYENYITNITGTPTLSQLIGTFHGIPVLPSSECGLGLLTRIGASQLLKTGKVLSDVYRHHLKINGSLLREEVKVFSTRYRRTFQSGLAFLFSFLQKDLFPKVLVQESPSLAFCFDDCACPAADLFLRRAREERELLIKSRPTFLNLVRSSSAIVYEVPDKKVSSDPHALKDALLTYICHNARFPCLDSRLPTTCVKPESVISLFNYLEWESQQMRVNINMKKTCFLRAYGLLKNIVSYLLRIVSERKPKVVLYSGHDKTISYLTMALGIRSNGVLTPFYSSRLIIEMYKTHDQLPDGGPVGSNYFFRIIFNGKDVTRELKFCKNAENSYHSPQGNQESNNAEKKFFLCPIESIVRFLHEDYFTIFNATNIKDACAVPS